MAAGTTVSSSLPLGPGVRSRRIRETLAGIRHKIFVTSGKGGVGKSSVTVNLAVALADAGWRVGILDVDFHGPSIPTLLGLHMRCEADGPHAIRPLRYGDRLSVMSMDGLLPDRNAPVMWRGPQKTGAVRQFLSDVVWGPLDVLLVDSPPGTGDEHMAVLSSIPDARCILVTTPQEVALADVRKAIGYLRRVDADILGIVENMSSLVCPHCGKEIALFAQGGGRRLAEDQHLAFLGSIPLDPEATEAADRGVPSVHLTGKAVCRAFLDLADVVKRCLVQQAEDIGQ